MAATRRPGASESPAARRSDEDAGAESPWRIARLVAALVAGAATSAHADIMPLVVNEGTNLGVTASTDEHLFLHLAGRLWRLPAHGGDAVAITAAGEFARRPAISPDGQMLAYEAARDGTVQVYLADVEGRGHRQVTNGPANHISPAWSPDGERLALASDRGGDFSIWDLDIKSLALRQLSFEPGAELDPAWAPAGDSIAYVKEQDGGHSLVLRQSSRPPRLLVTSPAPLHSPSWRPDGSVITYVAGLPEGPRLNMVILSDPPVIKMVAPGQSAANGPASWLDRTRFVYAADGHIHRREFGAVSHVEVPFVAQIEISTAAAAPSRRLPEPAVDQPVRSLGGITPLQDGTVIASALGDLWEIDAGGQPVRQLSDSPYVERDPAVSEDGRLLAFSSDRSGSAQIWVIELKTGKARQVSAEPGEARHPAWQPGTAVLAYLAGAVTGPPGMTLKLASLETGESTLLATGLAATSTAPTWSADGAWIGTLQNSPRNPQLLLFSADRPHERRRVTLPAVTLGSGSGQVQFSPDGTRLLVASADGIYLLPIAANGLVGADWLRLTDRAVHAARWAPGLASVWFADDGGLGRVGIDEPLSRAPLGLTWQTPVASGRSTIRASRVFDGLTDGYLFNQDVVIEDGRIVAVEPWAAEPAGYFVDARGKTVVPGLIDAAVSLAGAGGGRSGRSLLAYGVTTIQAVDAAGPGLRDIAERWRAQRSGPRVLQLLDWCISEPVVQDMGPAISSGAAEVCTRTDGAASSPASIARELGLSMWSADWRAALSGPVDVVNPVDPWERDRRRALLGDDGLYYQDAIGAIIHSGAALLPRVGGLTLPLLAERYPDLLESAQFRSMPDAGQLAAGLNTWRTQPGLLAARRSWLQARMRLASHVHAGGGRIVVGTGAAAGHLGLALHAELRALAAAGLKPAAALRAATAEAARALGLQEEIGTIAPGRVADLLIIDGDPLTDLNALLHIESIMVGGHIQPLATMLEPEPGALEKFTPPPSGRSLKKARKRR